MSRFLFATLPEWIMGSLMLAAIALNFANVVARYAFGHAIFWTEEVLVYMIVWGVFIGMAAVAYNGAHLTMDLFSGRFRGRWRTALNVAMTAVFLVCCVFVAVQSFQVVALLARSGQVSLAAGIPKAVAHAALLVGFVLTALAVVVRIRSYVSGKF